MAKRTKTPSAWTGARKVKTPGGTEYNLYELPTFCPRCRRHAIPQILGPAALVTYDEGMEWVVNVPLWCGRCGLAYIGEYAGDQYNPYDDSKDLSYIGTAPEAEPHVEVSDALAKISPSFAKVYDEAVAAQAAGLEELSGAGYRRALEFLVKDYLISKEPAKEEHFRKTPLAVCIRDHIDLPEIQDLAKEAVVIGNDFVHYTQYSKREVKELRGLINLVWRWIELQEEIRMERDRLAALKREPDEAEAPQAKVGILRVH